MMSGRMWLVALLCCVGLSSVSADEDLDAELDAAWGDKRTKTTTIESPKQRYEARLRILEARRDAQLQRCTQKSGGGPYCRKYSEEDFRREVRGLEREFEGQLDKFPEPRKRARGFQ